ncbi:putative type I phosphodiesterase nucleotide pyrophosphatase [Rosellinia necatrix]|uniref:Putative type I phosphodiesterase nucleotide pyrophosphatase n=1 Tax=Rosellinia necatrix TaxID=77044 RepID=A0A1W2TTC1_ROSNE|nr:putative type I phosphodiesterase nucleotide pyrophosphatase [Rosellinia necatrix]
MAPQQLDTAVEKDRSLLSPRSYDDDAVSLHSRSDQDTDSEDDQVLAAARNSRELRARDRMVLMEEDEMDQLVIDSRAQQERQRRGSGLERRGSNLSLPNPLLAFRKYSKVRSGTAIHDPSSSAEDLHDEKRSSRRNRRKEKRERLLRDARDGEDGELMHEMEGGTIKNGSSTGESSDREDSDELDRQHLLHVSGVKSAKKRRWRKWLLIYVAIATSFVLLGVLAWRLTLDKKRSTAAHPKSNGTALFAPTTLIISLDGFRADFLTRGLTPRLNAFIKEGVSPLYMTPSFPSVTFPNHYTLATGLYPESHGVVGNTFWDPALQADFYYTDPDRSLDPKWWGGEPFWVTAELQGVRTAVHMWPGSEAHIHNMDPTFLDKFNGKEALPKKVDRILEFIDKPGLENPDAEKRLRPQLIAAYVPNVDAIGHRYGPNSTEIQTTISEVDSMLDELFHGLEQRNLTNIVNVIIVSDHGMATTDVSRMIQIEDLVDISKVKHIDGWPLVGIRPKKPEDLQVLYEQAVNKVKTNPNFDVYLKDKDMPERFHFNNNDRIAPLWIIPKTGWAIVEKAEFDIQEAKAKNISYHPRGLHGYDHEHPLMRAIFVARGPAFPHQPHSQVETFQNINVYNILCDSINMEPMPNNGTLRLPLKVVGLHNDEMTIEQPDEDPAPISTSTTIVEDAATAILTTSTLSSIPPPTHSSTKGSMASVGVDPVTDEPKRPTRPAKPEKTNEPQPTEGSQQDSSDKPETPDESKASSWWDSVKEGFGWVKDKFHEIIDQVNNAGS